MMENDGFQVINRNKRKKKNGYLKTSPEKNLSYEFDEKSCCDKVCRAVDELKTTDFYFKCKAQVTEATQHLLAAGDEKACDVVAYGLGHFSDCVIARYQLALLLALRQDLKSLGGRCEVYDPRFYAGEKSVLTLLHLQPLANNEEGKRSVKGPVVFYMPHCGKTLYNNLLWANWHRDKMTNIVVIGNSFINIVQSVPERVLAANLNYIQRIQPYTKELELPLDSMFYDVFNDTSVHVFPREVIQDLSEENWMKKPEPIYSEDLDFIPVKKEDLDSSSYAD